MEIRNGSTKTTSSLLRKTEEGESSGVKMERPRSFPGAGTLDLIQLTSVEKKKKSVNFPPNVLLQLAIIEGDLEEVERLIGEFGARIVNEREPIGITPAMRCVFENQLGVLAILAKAGTDFAACDGENWTVLHVASTMDNINAAKFILAHSKSSLTQVPNVDGERALDLAESPEMTRLLLKAEVTHRPDTKLAMSEGERDELAILKHVKGHFDRNGSITELNKVLRTSTKHDSLLHLAAARNYTKLATYLLTHELGELEHQDRRGKTPLHAAVLHDSSEVAQLLVKYGAYVSTSCTAIPAVTSRTVTEFGRSRITFDYIV